jgi:hypothetical protein|tara:strand:+ start:4426 stop:4677 length:252 start_codon:yes stop_codon:yes gene_type:complete
LEFSKVEIISLLGVLGSVISALWIMLKGMQKRDDERLKRFEIKHEQNHDKIVELSKQHGELKGRIDGITQLSASVLDEIKRLK